MRKSIVTLAGLLAYGSALAGGALPPNPDLYGSILVDDLSHRQTAMAGQPGVGDVPGTHSTQVRHAVRRNAFVHPDLSQSILTDIGYDF